jgi:hypothetical protein
VNTKTDLQRIKDFCSDWGIDKILLRPNESLLELNDATPDDPQLTVLIRRYRVEELRTQSKVTAAGTLVRTWEWVDTDSGGCYAETDPYTVWDADFEPIYIPHHQRRVKTIAEYIEARERERMAYRVGTDSFPMDSFDRTFEDFDGTKAMRQHWSRSDGWTIKSA